VVLLKYYCNINILFETLLVSHHLAYFIYIPLHLITIRWNLRKILSRAMLCTHVLSNAFEHLREHWSTSSLFKSLLLAIRLCLFRYTTFTFH